MSDPLQSGAAQPGGLNLFADTQLHHGGTSPAPASYDHFEGYAAEFNNLAVGVQARLSRASQANASAEDVANLDAGTVRVVTRHLTQQSHDEWHPQGD